MACNKKKYTGRDVVLEFVIGCGDELPDPSEWERLGSMRTKEFGIEWETVDGTADDSMDALRENLATFQSLTISGDGTLKGKSLLNNITELTRHVAKPEATGGQPTAWMRMTFPDLTFTAFMLISNMSRSAPYDDVATYSLEASATASDFGLIIEDTPNPDVPAVVSLSVAPATAAIDVGDTQQLTATVLPGEASQDVVWVSSNPAVAKVSVTGLVTGMAAGTATVSARSRSDWSKVDVCDVTVTAA